MSHILFLPVEDDEGDDFHDLMIGCTVCGFITVFVVTVAMVIDLEVIKRFENLKKEEDR